MTTCTILYKETKAKWDQFNSIPADEVQVMLRKWSAGRACDVVLETLVRVDGEKPIRTRAAYDGYSQTDAEFQRKAIACFDNLVRRHPALGAADD